jgi:Na+-driven multidrug efflux pump
MYAILIFQILTGAAQLFSNAIVFLIIERMSPMSFLRIPILPGLRENLKTLFRVGRGNFGDSLIRNIFYFFVTLKFINYLGETEAGAWNLLNTIVWGLLLIPSFTVASYIKVRLSQPFCASPY